MKDQKNLLNGLTGGRETPGWQEINGEIVSVNGYRPGLYSHGPHGTFVDTSFVSGALPKGTFSDSVTITPRPGYPSILNIKIDGRPYARFQVGSYSEHTNSATATLDDGEYEKIAALPHDDSITFSMS